MTIINAHILYVIISIGYSNVTLSSQEYKSFESCETAKELVLKKIEPTAAKAIIFCVKK